MLQPLTPGQPHNERKQQKQCTAPSSSAHMPIHLASVRHTAGTSSAPANPLFLTFPTSQNWQGRDCCPHFAELANVGAENIRGFPKVRAEGKSQDGRTRFPDPHVLQTTAALFGVSGEKIPSRNPCRGTHGGPVSSRTWGRPWGQLEK